MEQAIINIFIFLVFFLVFGGLGGILLLMLAAKVLEKHGHKELSLKINRVLAKTAHSDTLPRLNLARSLVQNGRLEEAAQEYSTLLRLQPNPDAYMELANVYEKLSRPQEAINTYQALLVLAGPNPPEESQPMIQEIHNRINSLSQVSR